MSPHVRNWTLGAVALFAFGVYVITSNVDPNATLNRQPVKAAAKPAPVPVKVAPPAVTKTVPATTPKPPGDGIVATFEGGAFGDRSTVTYSPEFTVNHDWSVEVTTRGEFVEIGAEIVTKPQPPPKKDETPEESLKRFEEAWAGGQVNRGFRMIQPPKSFTKDVTVGGKYHLWFSGNGVWKVTIRQGTGKL